MKASITVAVDSMATGEAKDADPALAAATLVAENLAKQLGDVQVQVMHGAKLVACFSPGADKALIERLRDMNLDVLAIACEATPRVCEDLRRFQRACTPLSVTAEKLFRVLHTAPGGQKPSALLKSLAGHTQVSKQVSDWLLELAELAER